jgi:hypothetical protein
VGIIREAAPGERNMGMGRMHTFDQDISITPQKPFHFHSTISDGCLPKDGHLVMFPIQK